MRSRVYLARASDDEGIGSVSEKLARLLRESAVLSAAGSWGTAAVKIHFGEEGNTGFVRPEYAGVVCRAITGAGARCFLSDTNTLYRGRRMNAPDHLALAREHGFTEKVVGAPVVVPDELREADTGAVELNGRFIKTAKIARLFLDAGAVVALSHFKGHMMTGFGGALKNIGMGCAAREGKLAQHSDIAPIVILEKCVGCGVCVQTCPVDTIFLEKDKAYIDPSKCTGCASCIAACEQNAIDVQWEAGGSLIQEKMVEFARAVLGDRKRGRAFVNFILKVTKECDCLARDDPRVVPDIGIVASTDPVSVDKASFDLVTAQAGRDIFRELHPSRDGMKQLLYAEELGLGKMEYELIEV